MNKVLIPTKLSDVAANTLKTAGYEVIQDADTPLEKQVAAHPDAVALIVRSEKVTPEIMDALPSLKLVVRAGAGYDNIDIVYARKKNVDVMNTPGANSNAVAEEVMAMILAYYRHIVQADATTREGLWEKKKYMGSELTKKTVGIIGLGNIGRNLVKRLQGFEPILLGYDHFLARQRALNIGVTPTSIEDIFSQCDIITLHVPGGPSTHHMVNAELIGKMKDGAVLINCSRYGVVDEEALAAAKAAGKNIGYLTDVHPKDAPGEKPSAPIADLILPHLGANTREANTKAAKRAAEQMIAYFSDGDTSCVVNGESPSGLNPAHLQLAFLLASLARKAGGNKPIRQAGDELCGGNDQLWPKGHDSVDKACDDAGSARSKRREVLLDAREQGLEQLHPGINHLGREVGNIGDRLRQNIADSTRGGRQPAVIKGVCDFPNPVRSHARRLFQRLGHILVDGNAQVGHALLEYAYFVLKGVRYLFVGAAHHVRLGGHGRKVFRKGLTVFPGHSESGLARLNGGKQVNHG